MQTHGEKEKKMQEQKRKGQTHYEKSQLLKTYRLDCQRKKKTRNKKKHKETGISRAKGIVDRILASTSRGQSMRYYGGTYQAEE